MNRRNFLKSIASGVAVATIPGGAKAVADQIEKSTYGGTASTGQLRAHVPRKVKGKVREIIGYDVVRDQMVASWTASDGAQRVYIDAPLEGRWRESMPKLREAAYKELAPKIAEMGPLIELEIPPEYERVVV